MSEDPKAEQLLANLREQLLKITDKDVRYDVAVAAEETIGHFVAANVRMTYHAERIAEAVKRAANAETETVEQSTNCQRH